jgi:hypothetical protein
MSASPRPVRQRQSQAVRLVMSLVVAVCLVLGLTGSPAQAAEAGRISGRLVDSTTSAALQAASVLVRPAGDDDAEPIVTDVIDGAFTVAGVPVGQYTVEFRDVSGEHLAEFYDNSRYVTGAKTVAVTAGGDTPLGVVGLDRGSSLAGLVESRRVPAPGESDREPAVGVTVSALPVVAGVVDQQHVVSTTTRDDGTYSIGHLPAGQYKVRVSGDLVFDAYSGGTTSEQSAQVTTLGVAADATLPTIVLEKTAGIIGAAENAAGAPLEGIAVDALPGGGGSSAQGAATTTDAEGAFAFTRLHAGTYRLRFRDPSGVYRERSDTEITVEGGENEADASTIVLSPVAVPAPAVPPAVTKRSATVKVSAKGARKKATLTITLRASGVTPTGTVKIKLGSRTLKTVRLKAGKAKVTVKKQKKGKRSYKVVYSGDSTVRGKTVTSKKVRIR